MEYIEYVTELPKSDSIWDKIVDEFLQSGWEYARVIELEGKSARTVKLAIRNRCIMEELPVEVVMAGDSIYLERLPDASVIKWWHRLLGLADEG